MSMMDIKDITLIAVGKLKETYRCNEGRLMPTRHAAPCLSVVLASEIVQRCVAPAHQWGVARPGGNVTQMIWSLPEVIAHIFALFALMPGDLIMTGTPAGVAAVSPVDRLEGEVEGVGRISVKVV